MAENLNLSGTKTTQHNNMHHSSTMYLYCRFSIAPPNGMDNNHGEDLMSRYFDQNPNNVTTTPSLILKRDYLCLGLNPLLEFNTEVNIAFGKNQSPTKPAGEISL